MTKYFISLSKKKKLAIHNSCKIDAKLLHVAVNNFISHWQTVIRFAKSCRFFQLIYNGCDCIDIPGYCQIVCRSYHLSELHPVN